MAPDKFSQTGVLALTADPLKALPNKSPTKTMAENTANNDWRFIFPSLG
jgi:hypothetical protein